jgi:phosphate transport system substrate-binding protein
VRSLSNRLEQLNADIKVEVLPSLGTPGGIEALVDGAIDIAVAGRPLKLTEREKGISEVSCMTTALVFATSHPNPPGINLSEVPNYYADLKPAWPDGTPLKVILRSRAGSENPYLAKAIPGMEQALEGAYKRGGIPVGATDQENVDLAHRTPGSFTVTTMMQLVTENVDLRIVPVGGRLPSLQTLADGSYPFPLRVCLVTRDQSSPGVTRFIDFTNSTEGQQMLRDFNILPLGKP